MSFTDSRHSFGYAADHGYVIGITGGTGFGQVSFLYMRSIYGLLFDIYVCPSMNIYPSFQDSLCCWTSRWGSALH